MLDDVKDLEQVASILMRGTFQSAGQNCIGIERIIALPKSYDRLVKTLEPRVRSLRVGSALDIPSPSSSSSTKPPTTDGDNEEQDQGIDVGAMISPHNFSHLSHLIHLAVKSGARLLAGGSQHHHPVHPRGHYFTPTLLVDVTPTMVIANEELFAPVALVMRASSITDAIAIANGTPFALGSSVFGTSKKDLERVTREVKAGMVAVNDFGVTYAVGLPFGGVKGSGYGRFGGEEGLRSLCNVKSVCVDRVPGGLVGTSIPRALDYPIRDARGAWEFVRGVVEVGYASGWAWLGGLVRVVRNG